MKKCITGFLMALLVALGVVGLFSTKAQAESNLLPLNTWKTEYIQTVQGETYQIHLPKDGVITLEMKNNATSKWDMVVTNQQQKELLTVSSTTYLLDGSTTKREIGLAKGTYTIQVKGNWGNFDTTSSLFRVGFKAHSNYEKEDNTLLQDANSTSLNKTYYGNISSSNDRDSFKFSLKAVSKVTLNLSNHKNVQWEAVLYDASEGEYLRLKSAETSAGSTSSDVGLSKGTYYLVIRQLDLPKYNNERYNFKISTQTNQNVEQENNDTIATATPLPLSKTYTGIATTSSDLDYYRSEIKKNNTYTVFSLKNKSTSSWLVTVYNEMGGEIGTFITKKKKTGNTTFATKLPQGNYYVRVSDQSNAVNVPYQIKVYTKAESKAVSSKNIKIINKKGAKDTITVNKVSKKSIIRVYNEKGKLIKKSSASSNQVKLNLNLVKKAGFVYVTQQRSNQLESSKTKVKYNKKSSIFQV